MRSVYEKSEGWLLVIAIFITVGILIGNGALMLIGYLGVYYACTEDDVTDVDAWGTDHIDIVTGKPDNVLE